MTKRISRRIGLIMLICAIVFLIVALCHPEMSFIWGNGFTYFLYGLYLLAMIILLIAPFPKKKKYVSRNL